MISERNFRVREWCYCDAFLCSWIRQQIAQIGCRNCCRPTVVDSAFLKGQGAIAIDDEGDRSLLPCVSSGLGRMGAGALAAQQAA
jgi:hypothetical protein